MKIFRIEVAVLIVFYLTAIAKSSELEIFRTRLSSEDGWRIGIDTFRIPPSLCSKGAICVRFGAVTDGQCSCQCPTTDATFLFENNEWRCSNNERVRTLLGYNPSSYTGFDSELLSNPLRMIYINDRRRISLSPDLLNCQVDAGISWYIGCNGSELFNNNTNLFTIMPDGDPADKPPYFLEVQGSVANTQWLKGRIIKLGIVCDGPVQRWMLFKFVGSIKCLAPTLPSPVTTKPLDTTAKSLPSKGKGVVGITTTVSEDRPTVAKVLPTAPTRQGRDRATYASSSWGLIAGLTASLMFAAIIFGFIVYRHVYSKKFKKPPLPAKTIKRGVRNSNEVSPQSPVAQAPDVENGYRELNVRHPTIYTANYQVPPRENPRPMYASLNFPVGVPVGRKTVTHADIPDSAEYIDPDYDSALRPKEHRPISKNKRPISVEQVVYNQMEELYLKGPLAQMREMSRKGHLAQMGEMSCKVPFEPRPVHGGVDNNPQPGVNILEPYLQCSKRPSHYGTLSSADAIFNTLEKPNPDSANELESVPEYYVLEKEPSPGVHTR